MDLETHEAGGDGNHRGGRGSVWSRPHLARLDDGVHLRALLEAEVLQRRHRDRRGDGLAAADVDGDDGRDLTAIDAGDLALEDIARAELHVALHLCHWEQFDGWIPRTKP